MAAAPGVAVEPTLDTLPIGIAKVLREGSDIALLAFGTMVTPAQYCADQLDATLVNMRFVKPLDETLILQLAESHKVLITIEEKCRRRRRWQWCQ